jgi:hypothetical protein
MLIEKLLIKRRREIEGILGENPTPVNSPHHPLHPPTPSRPAAKPLTNVPLACRAGRRRRAPAGREARHRTAHAVFTCSGLCDCGRPAAAFTM